MWFERDRRGVHSMGTDARGQRRYFSAETIAAIEALPLAELEALHDALAELEADVLVDYDPEDESIDHADEDGYRFVRPPTSIAFPPVTSDFDTAFTAHVEGLPKRWRLDASALAFELVGTVLAPYWAEQRARRSATWRLTARRQHGSRRVRRR
ncbi:hypothetical protein DEJ28_04485 [Curtobacterium sp. MCPF17_002]|uniref:hypothetical protein n=1 Tax=Curtobacterium sp. MCPF17_002 TaxID=2175645 RepID=UPI000DAA3826|nr:hypothetical protein [Curtobacterium sp. MCPF17_002]WIB78367.1 hypothetical protein DEJ28_04485 [Curtobacterium sp. MCPF17_002]